MLAASRSRRLIAAAQAVLETDPAVSEWRSLAELDPRLVAAVVLAEDRHFWRHHGIDWSAVRAAARKNLRQPGLRIGASTIPMQVARMLHRWSRRSYVRKLGESLVAVWLVARYERETVLELYLNLAPFAAGTRGVAAASAGLLGRDPAQLSLFEATLLASVLNDPGIAPGSTPRSASWLRYKQQHVLDQLVRSEDLDPAEVAAASAQVQARWGTDSIPPISG